MGQYDLAINLFDLVLADYPDHVQALLYRGIGLLQSGDTAQAIDTWEIALEMAGGSHPDIEYLLATATGNVSAGTTSQPQQQPSQPQQDGYHLHIELASGARTASGATLFVFLKAEESGPPAAVRRILNPRFPMDITIDSDDVMIADTSLPSTGALFVRLDADGSASTKDAGDLEAQVNAAINSQTTLRLEP
jgi:cytochrome c-type biogenesis protein CcmH